MKKKSVSFLVFLLVLSFIKGFFSFSVAKFAFANPPDASKWSFYSGDGHIHSMYSRYDWDYLHTKKSPPTVYEQHDKAVQLGYKWIIITDHEQMMNDEEFQRLRADCQNCQKMSFLEKTDCLIAAGVEMGNCKMLVSHGHFLTYNVPFKPQWVKTLTWDAIPADPIPDRDFFDVIKDIGSVGGFGFIAHPHYYRMPWQRWDLIGQYLPEIQGYLGLEWINSAIPPDEFLKRRTMAFWSQGKPVPIISNSDSHWPEKIGCSYSYVYLPSNKITLENLYSSLRKGRLVVSNGPFAAILVGHNVPGDEIEVKYDQKLDLNIVWSTNEGCGKIREIKVYDKAGIWKNEPIIVLNPQEMEGSIPKTYTPKEDTFLYLEAITEKDKVAYTNPIFLKLRKRPKKNIDLLLLLDDSSRMMWVSDYSNEQRPKIKEGLIDVLRADDSFGIVYFDGDAHPIPMLEKINDEKDKESLKSFSQIPAIYPITSGSDIDRALEVGLEEFKRNEELNRKVAVLASDGIDTNGFGGKILEEYKRKGIKIHTILVSEGSEPPTERLKLFGRKYLWSPPEPNTLKKIASQTGGKYYSSVEKLAALKEELQKERDRPFIYGQRIDLSNPTFVLKPNESVEQKVEVSAKDSQINFIIEWLGSKFSLTLVDPCGREINQTTQDLDIIHFSAKTSESYSIRNPIPGTWTLKVQAIEVPKRGEEVKITVTKMTETPPKIILTPLSNHQIVTGTVEVKAIAEDEQEIISFGLYVDGQEKQTCFDLNQKICTITYNLDAEWLEEGYHQISALAIDANYTADETSTLVIVDNKKPKADVGPDRIVREDTKILFDASDSSGYINPEFGENSFFWNFGDGKTTATIVPRVSYNYKKPGVYILCLKVKDEAGNSDQDTAKIKVLAKKKSMKKAETETYIPWISLISFLAIVLVIELIKNYFTSRKKI